MKDDEKNKLSKRIDDVFSLGFTLDAATFDGRPGYSRYPDDYLGLEYIMSLTETQWGKFKKVLK